MAWRKRLVVCGLAVAAAVPAGAVSPGREVWLPAAARLSGWVTDLTVLNPGDQPAEVELTWLERDLDNRTSAPVHLTVAAGATAVLDDVILTMLGRTSAAGAFRIVADQPVVVSSRIWNGSGGGGTRGQGFEGVPAAAALVPGEVTHIPGLASNAAFRSNLFAVSTAATPTTLQLELLDPDGTVLATSPVYTLAPWAAFYRPVTDLGGPDFDHGTVRARVLEGSAIVVGSRVDNTSLDPTTLEAWWSTAPAASTAGTWYGTVTDAGGFLGGITLAVGDDDAVERVDLTYPSPVCDIFFAAGATFSPALLLANLAGGVDLEESYPGGGHVSFTLTLAATGDATLLSGTVVGTGSGFTGDLVACNGAQPAADVRLGKTGR